MHKRTLLSLALLAVLGAACDGDQSGSGQADDRNRSGDAATDVGADSVADARGEIGSDVSDTAPDSTADTPLDTAEDADASTNDSTADADSIDLADAADASDVAPDNTTDARDMSDATDTGDVSDADDSFDLPDLDPPEPCDIPEIRFAFDPETDCSNMYTGAVIITSNDDEDWALLNGVDCVEGGIVVERTTLATISLPDLEYVSQNLVLWGNGATAFDLPKLARIGGELQMSSSSVTDLTVPVLEEVGDILNVERMNQLEAFSLPNLLRVGGNIELGDGYSNQLESLTHVSLPELVVIGGNQFVVGSELPVNIDASKLVQSGRLGAYGGLDFSCSIGDAFLCARDCTGSFEDCLSRCGGPVEVKLGSLCTANGIRIYYPQHVDLTVDLGSLRDTDSLSVGTIQDGRIRSIDLGDLQRSESLGVSTTGFTPIDMPQLNDCDSLQLSVIEPRFPFVEGCGADCVGSFAAPQLSAARSVAVVCEECEVDLSELRVVTSALLATGNPAFDLGEIRSIHIAQLTSSGQRAVSAVTAAAINQLEIESAIESPIRLDGVAELESLTLSSLSGSEPRLMDKLVAPDLITASRIYLDFSGVIELVAPQLETLTEFENNGSSRFATVDFGSLSQIADFEWRNSYGGVNVAFESIETLGQLAVGTSNAAPEFPNLDRAETVYSSLNGTALVLPATSIGTLSLTGRPVVWFRAPSLTTIDDLDLHNSSEPEGPLDLTEALPVLDEITGSFQMDSAWYATSLLVPNLRTIGGNTYIRYNSRLTSISFPDLETSFGIRIEDNRDLESVSLPSLDEVDWFTISENPALPQCDLIAQAHDLFTPPPERGRYCVEDNADDCADDCP